MGLIADIHKDLERGVVQLIVEYRGRLRSEAVGMCKDETQAEDLVFRTFERVLAKIDTYQGRYESVWVDACDHGEYLPK